MNRRRADALENVERARGHIKFAHHTVERCPEDDNSCLPEIKETLEIAYGELEEAERILRPPEKEE
ncbi:MAG: hypothetical protein H0W76_22715 [Pyrinomonadaceae bacterium]|nr:hypothetical protein [Pyrinomonadaceae bacterium]